MNKLLAMALSALLAYPSAATARPTPEDPGPEGSSIYGVEYYNEGLFVGGEFFYIEDTAASCGVIPLPPRDERSNELETRQSVNPVKKCTRVDLNHLGEATSLRARRGPYDTNDAYTLIMQPYSSSDCSGDSYAGISTDSDYVDQEFGYGPVRSVKSWVTLCGAPW